MTEIVKFLQEPCNQIPFNDLFLIFIGSGIVVWILSELGHK